MNDEATLRIEPLREAALEATASTGRDDELALEILDRQLRDRVRASMGFPLRPTWKELNRADHARSLGIEPNYDLDASRAVDVSMLQTMKFPNELEAILEKISGDARLAEQEMGLSTLYLAFGFLEWYDADTSDKKAFAPLLLLPVSLQKSKVRGKTVFSLSAREDRAEANLSLQKLLEQRARVLPDFEANEGPAIGSIETYLDQVKIAVDGLKNWKIYRWLVLGHFSFGRFAMYADLDQQRWGDVTSHDLVGSMLQGVERTRDPNALPSVPEDYPIDDVEIEKAAPFLIHDADASQHSAVVDVMRGKNLVIQGPPGTGKSQTITNIVANLLADGKRVLFLAEKQAALEVVKRRLDSAGLGHFCLELHSDKASPKSVIASLQERHQLDTRRSSANAVTAVDPVWAHNRLEITSYVNGLHHVAEDGATTFDMIWRALRGRRSYADLTTAFKAVSIASDLLRDPVELSRSRDEMRVLAEMQESFTQSFGHPNKSPWTEVSFGNFPAFDARRLVEALVALRELTRVTIAAVARHAETGAHSAAEFVAFAALKRDLRTLPDANLLVEIANLDLDDLERAASVRLDMLSTEADLAEMPNLRHDDPERLAIAATHLRGSGAAEFGNRTPDDAYSSSTYEIVLLTELIRALEGILPSLDALGLGPNIPSSWLAAAATVIDILAVTPDHARRWLLQLQHVEERDVANAQARLKSLLEADTEWSSRLSGYNIESRPILQNLVKAADTLQKRQVDKLIAKLGGSWREATDLCEKLGADPTRPEDLEGLARHLGNLAAFETDEALRQLFGPAWAGVSTPVDAVRESVQVRLYIRSKIKPLAGANEVLARALTLSPELAGSLGPLRDNCGMVLDLTGDARDRLGETHAARLLNEGRSRLSFLTNFLAIDPTRALAGLDAPIRQIAYTHELVTRVGRICRRFKGTLTSADGQARGSSRDRVAASGRTRCPWARAAPCARLKKI